MQMHRLPGFIGPGPSTTLDKISIHLSMLFVLYRIPITASRPIKGLHIFIKILAPPIRGLYFSHNFLQINYSAKNTYRISHNKLRRNNACSMFFLVVRILHPSHQYLTSFDTNSSCILLNHCQSWFNQSW